ncbi:hypothetical protein H5410_020023 [Solanum commersonii]|uniref:Uncharacterized protein n=1 Tax=Solanum commersonii TaxID=4109 RepID=A0A9J5ZCY0_SOLCO|nr:hypothetical protein H5410_020023 [Solanum commersonii]
MKDIIGSAMYPRDTTTITITTSNNTSATITTSTIIIIIFTITTNSVTTITTTRTSISTNKDVVFQEDVFPFKFKSTDPLPIFTYTGINHEVDGLKEGSIATHSQHNSQAELLPQEAELLSQEQVENAKVETSTNL